jgi:hypothetical protein
MGLTGTTKVGRVAKAPAWRAPLSAPWAGPARSARRRRRYAEGLERAVERARAPWSPLSPAVPVSLEAGGDAPSVLLDLAEWLRQPRPVRSEGVERVRRLLCDGAGPLYYGAPGDLRVAAWFALAALDSDGP